MEEGELTAEEQRQVGRSNPAAALKLARRRRAVRERPAISTTKSTDQSAPVRRAEDRPQPQSNPRFDVVGPVSREQQPKEEQKFRLINPITETASRSSTPTPTPTSAPAPAPAPVQKAAPTPVPVPTRPVEPILIADKPKTIERVRRIVEDVQASKRPSPQPAPTQDKTSAIASRKQAPAAPSPQVSKREEIKKTLANSQKQKRR